MMSSIFSIPTEMRTSPSTIPSSCLLAGNQIAVRSRRRMQHTRKHIAETRRTHTQLQRIHKTKRRFRVLSRSSIETSAPSPG